MNLAKIAKIIRELLAALGEDPQREGLQKTPVRVARAYQKLLGGYNQPLAKIKTVFTQEDYDEMIICKAIDFYSLCEHHLLPFFGQIHIGYLPNKKILGISKLPRLVEIYARRLQNQERLTVQIAQAVDKLIQPKGVGVIIEGKHLCLIARGVEKQNSVMTTSACIGLMKTDPKTRTEFLKLKDRSQP